MQRQRAFALLELVIVLVLMALMLTLLAPAVQSARDAALKNSSRNNMKQLLLGMQNHADARRTFPPLYFISPKSELKNKLNPIDATGMYTWQVQLLPFIEEDLMYKGISNASNRFTIAADKVQIRNKEGKQVSPSTISLGQLQAPQLGPNLNPGLCNYVALAATRQPLLTNVDTAADGTQSFKKPFPDGMIIPDKLAKGASMARMADGTSRTAVLCESRELERSNWYTPQEVFVCGFLPGDSTAVKDVADQFYPYFHSDGSFVFNPEKGNRTALNYGPTAKDAKQAYNADEKDPLRRTWGPSGGHTQDITIHGMGDGSVQEVPSDIDPQVYYALITPRGGENVKYPWDNNDRPVGPPGLPETPRFDNTKGPIPVPPIELPELPVVPR